MNRIDKLFKDKGKDILSVYFTAGFPEIDDTIKVLRELVQNGVDLVEVGIPFSDLMADGPVIQHTGTVALENGMSLEKLFGQLSGLRLAIDIPVILMGYLNPVMQYGFDKFCGSCAACGVDGVIISDMPYSEYIQKFRLVSEKYDIKTVMLITPETSPERIRMIDENTGGFLYMVSTAATTGARESFDARTLDYFRRIDSMNLKHPRLIGFGISNPQTIKAAFANSSGAIIGSAFMKELTVNPDPRIAVEALMEKLGLR